MIAVRSYTDTDYEAVRKNLTDGNLFDETWDTQTTLRAKIQAQPDSILVATIESEVVGSVYMVQDIWNSFIFRLAVQTNFRGQGIGSRLLDESEKILKDKGCKNVALLVRADEGELIDFYKNRGYKPMTRLHQCMYKEL